MIAFAVPAFAYARLLLYHFYVQGSFLLDAGWTAFLISHGGLLLHYPRVLGGESYFVFHVSPIFIGLGLLRQIVPVSHLQYFAGFAGVAHALPSLAVFWVLYAGYGLRRGVGVVVAALIAVAFAFNGLALAIVRYPHSEILIAGSIILFAVALVRRRLIAAAVFFAIALLTREDSGLHVFGLLLVLVALNRWHGIGWRLQRAEMVFAAVGLTYSLLVLGLQRELSTAVSTMTITYLGDPPFAGLTATKLLSRLEFYVVYRAYLVLPALVAALWAARTRNPYILVGYAAFIPWALLQLIASTNIAGTLSGYYAYPFLIASFWPLVGVLFESQRRGGEGSGALPLLAFTAMIAVSFVGIAQQYNPGRLDLLAGIFSPPSRARQALTDRAIVTLVRSKPEIGAIVAGTSIVALMPDQFTPEETVEGRGSTRPSTAMYFVHGFEAGKIRAIAAASGLNWHYQVPGTSIRIATDRKIAAPAPIARMIVPADSPG